MAATGIGIGLHQFLDVHNVALVFLVGVLVTAVSFGLWPALFACILSMLAFNFFFLAAALHLHDRRPGERHRAPVLPCRCRDRQQSDRQRPQPSMVARQRAKTTEDLYQFSKKLAAVGTLDDVLWAAAFQIASMLKVRVVLLLPEDGVVAVRAGYPPEDQLQEADLAAARWAFDTNRPAGRGSDNRPWRTAAFPADANWSGCHRSRWHRQATARGRSWPRRAGACSMRCPTKPRLAVERVHLVEDVDRARLTAETDRLRTALLTSISHDLRTPLASILGSAGTLRDFSKHLDEATKRDLAATIQQEAERLNRFIANLLDMTRLESGRRQTEPGAP